MQLGAHVLASGLFVAPMAGVTDSPFRRLARRYGAALRRLACATESAQAQLAAVRRFCDALAWQGAQRAPEEAA